MRMRLVGGPLDGQRSGPSADAKVEEMGYYPDALHLDGTWYLCAGEVGGFMAYLCDEVPVFEPVWRRGA